VKTREPTTEVPQNEMGIDGVLHVVRPESTDLIDLGVLIGNDGFEVLLGGDGRLGNDRIERFHE